MSVGLGGTETSVYRNLSFIFTLLMVSIHNNKILRHLLSEDKRERGYEIRQNAF